MGDLSPLWDLTDRLDSVTVMSGDADPAWDHSDHAPVVATCQA